MKKFIKATKVKDSWSVKMTVMITAHSKSDVLDIIKYEGLKVRLSHKPTKENPSETIYAD